MKVKIKMINGWFVKKMNRIDFLGSRAESTSVILFLKKKRKRRFVFRQNGMVIEKTYGFQNPSLSTRKSNVYKEKKGAGMKKQNLNFLYNYVKRQCEIYKNASSHTAEWKAVMLHGIYQAAYEYIRDGGKRDVDKIIGAAIQRNRKDGIE